MGDEETNPTPREKKKGSEVVEIWERVEGRSSFLFPDEKSKEYGKEEADVVKT